MRLPAAVAALAMCAWDLRAQAPQTVQWEGRLDFFFANATTVQLGGAGAWTLDPNVRLVLAGGLGSTFTDGAGQFSARVDVLARYVLDPERTQKWALYGTGGISVRYEAQPNWHGALVALIGLEGPKWGTWTPFVEGGYGGGVQLGLGLRRAKVTGR